MIGFYFLKEYMAITIKSEEEIKKMRVAGKLAANVLDMIAPFVIPGVTTNQLNTLCHDFIVNEQYAIPAPLNYNGFPKSICTSINNVACHGIPNDDVLKEGDILNIDVTVLKDGYHGDTSKMFFVGEPSFEAEELVHIAQECLYIGIELIEPGIHLGDIGYAIQEHAKYHGYSIVREYCGHGIGKLFQEEPQVLHYGKQGTGKKLVPGMTFTIEPMVNRGKRHTRLLADQWTVVTKDNSLSAQWEHTILVTTEGFEILTHRKEEIISTIGSALTTLQMDN